MERTYIVKQEKGSNIWDALHTDGLTFDQGLCDYYFTTNCGEYRFGLTPVILI